MIVDGTTYPDNLHPGAIATLERNRQDRFAPRITVHYRAGYSETGRISRSLGPAVRGALIVHNARSRGGGLIGGDIVKITAARGGRTIWELPTS